MDSALKCIDTKQNFGIMPNFDKKRKRLLEGPISPGQCRAARAVVGWSQDDLAAAAGLVGMTVQSFERGARLPHQNNLMAIRNALESKGVRFLEPEEGMPGLQFPPDPLE